MKYNRLSSYKIKKIISCFVEDLPATKTANILQINRNTINSYYNEFRRKIFEHLHHARQKFSGEMELDETYVEAVKATLEQKECEVKEVEEQLGRHPYLAF